MKKYYNVYYKIIPASGKIHTRVITDVENGNPHVKEKYKDYEMGCIRIATEKDLESRKYDDQILKTTQQIASNKHEGIDVKTEIADIVYVSDGYKPSNDTYINGEGRVFMFPDVGKPMFYM